MQNDFLTALKTHREYCRSFLELSKQQEQLANSDEYDEMLDLLTKKQRVIALMNELAVPFGKLSTHWKIIREGLPTAVQGECEVAIKTAEAFLSEALQREQGISAVMEARRDQTQRELQELAHRQQFMEPTDRGHQIFSISQ